ncbi:capsule-associated protein CAP1 [Puccinia graminis f. sp. tritici]|uniref:Capsule-associated protein CAP1 n=1 Tax=Puccinia graminis f. sp. tritici TaxID=56615 RepID=A0A5B0RS53_PUCGR|nr:capsule-associated protein CAP1 [Puccinia graminis f. sp. tritici]
MARLLTLPGKLRSRRSIKRIFIVSSWLFVLHELYSFLTHHRSTLPFINPSQQSLESDYILPPHPIQTRLESARQRWKDKLNSQSVDYAQFKAKYRKKYNLEPPEGMREWFKIVSADGVLLVDEFDSLMASLKPFRIMSPEELHRRTLEVAAMPTFSLLNITDAHAHFYGQNYRDDFAHYSRENYGPGIERVEGLASMMQRHIHRVPNGLIFAVSELAEPRVIVPWQDHPTTIESFELETLSMHKKDYSQQLKPIEMKKLLPSPAFGDSGNTWELYAKSCPPESSARKKLLSLTPDNAPAQHRDHFVDHHNDPIHVKRGKLKTGLKKRRSPGNLTRSSLDIPDNGANDGPPKGFPTATLLQESDEFKFVEVGKAGLSHEELCSNSELHENQGAFYSDWRSLPALYPVFSPSKIDGFSDILIPSNFYYGDDARYTFQRNETIPWEQKKSNLFWRGETTGGGNSPPGHQLQYQRHRFVRLAGRVSDVLKSLLVADPRSGMIRHIKRTITELNQAWLDIGFTGYTGCGDPKICILTEQLCPLKKTVPLKEMAKYKAILDLDGMAFSGRFVALMNMGSGVFKSSIYKDALTEWIEPWVHYIPIGGEYSELYNLLAYFLPLDDKEEQTKSKKNWVRRLWDTTLHKKAEGDEQLRQIAEDGLKWSENVGNKQDIEAYVYRLSLEWGRMMGKIGDEEVDPDEEVENDPSTIFDSLGPSQRYLAPDSKDT